MSSERIAHEIAGSIVGLILAGLLYVAMSWAWPEIRVPTVIIFLLSWGFTSVDTMILRRHGFMRTTSSGWRYIKWFDRGALNLRERMWGDMATMLLGAVVSSFVAGLAGKLWPAARWPVFLILFVLCAIVGVIAITAKRNDT
jgi:hypothetical protein